MRLEEDKYRKKYRRFTTKEGNPTKAHRMRGVLVLRSDPSSVALRRVEAPLRRVARHKVRKGQRYRVIEFRLGRVGEVVEAEVPAGAADRVIQRVCTDSRQIEKGDLFFALSGEHFDGHEFVGRAIEAGAVAAVVEKDGTGGAVIGGNWRC